MSAAKDPTFQDVLDAELEEIGKSRVNREQAEREIAGQRGKDDAFSSAGRSQLLGLSFSGGGIRSATFNLGVLQGLARLNLLKRFDYLSTVSGGGYIGSWLISWIHRKDLATVLRGLRGEPQPGEAPSSSSEPGEVRWLRQFSNYLTPRIGPFSADTWAVIGSYLRNLLLNQVILFLLLIGMLLAALFPVALFRAALTTSHYHVAFILPAGLALLIALATGVANISALMRVEGQEERRASVSLGTGPAGVHFLVLAPILGSAYLLWIGLLKRLDVLLNLRRDMIWGAVLFAAIWILAWLSGWLARTGLAWLIGRLAGMGLTRLIGWLARMGLASGPGADEKEDPATGVTEPDGQRKADPDGLKGWTWNVLVMAMSAAAAGAMGGLLLYALGRILVNPSSEETGVLDQWHGLYWGLPCVVGIFLLVESLHIGLVGNRFSEAAREWWARLGGLMLVSTAAWALVTWAAIDGPSTICRLARFYEPAQGWVQWGLAGLWAAITGAGVLAGRSPKTGGGEAGLGLKIAEKVAPPVFIIGLLLLLSAALQWRLPELLGRMQDSGVWAGSVLADGLIRLGPEPPAVSGGWNEVVLLSRSSLGLCLAAFLGALALSLRVGINDFSMHGFYRNRLVRCYLGASRWQSRKPQPFTGFDPEDDLPLDGLRSRAGDPPAAAKEAPMAWLGKGFVAKMLTSIFSSARRARHTRTVEHPFPIINTALNLVGGKELAWQQRKAASFMMTPLYCGYAFDRMEGNAAAALRETRAGRVRVGLALATSGAAASPNMGYHSSAPLAFLMTIFNVRLGWWIGNPRYAREWRLPGPRIGLWYLLCELMGRTDDRSQFVYLSDGGHFENLGIYELVRRRCRYIVACDASEDHDMKFGDLGSAIEKCRADFGIDIEIDIEPLRRDKETGRSRWHCVIGKIHYEKRDREIPTGTLVYLKASLTGDESTDVQRYKAENPVFPHQTTADQFFDESQFESYRMLGEHSARSVFDAVGSPDELAGLELPRLFDLLSQRWYPPSRAASSSFTRHTATCTTLIERMRGDEHLKFLDAQVFPEWRQLMHATPAAASVQRPGEGGDTFWLPSDAEDRRAGFYFCNEIIQLMEDVYLDLNLEEQFDHPDNRGWMNLLRHWAWSGMFRATWAISASVYGARFQRFCERRLDLRLGTVKIGDEIGLEDLVSGRATHLLNFWETRLIEIFGKHCSEGKTPPLSPELRPELLRVLPLHMVVRAPEVARGGPDRELCFAFGFALAEIEHINGRKGARIRYFRIQNHVRKTGLARLALLALRERYSLECAPIWFPEETRLQLLGETSLSRNVSLEEALPDAREALTFRQLMDSVGGRCSEKGDKESGA